MPVGRPHHIQRRIQIQNRSHELPGERIQSGALRIGYLHRTRRKHRPIQHFQKRFDMAWGGSGQEGAQTQGNNIAHDPCGVHLLSSKTGNVSNDNQLTAVAARGLGRNAIKDTNVQSRGTHNNLWTASLLPRDATALLFL